jgi:hypothetical protein
VSIGVTSYAGADFEFSVDLYDNATAIDTTGSMHIKTSGNYRKAVFSTVFKAASTTFTPILKGTKISGAGSGDARASSSKPLTIVVRKLGIANGSVA